MIWGAHKADGRLAAKNATKIRAALGQQIDPKRVYERYQETQPTPSGNLAQDRARARAWAMLNVGLDMEAIYPALIRLWTEAFVMGQLAAREAIRKTEALQKADNAQYIDWDNWTPGDEVAAALVRPPDALKRLLDQAGSRIRGLDKESYDEIGSALGESIALGLSSSSAARLIRSKVHSASRALTIAITETNRVASYAAMQTYKEYGLEKQEWQAVSPCDICAKNEGAVVEIGSPFPSGVIQPPQHPHCRCALLPVIPDMSDQPNENGVVDVMPTSPRPVESKEELLEQMSFQRDAGFTRQSVPFAQEDALDQYTKNSYMNMQDKARKFPAGAPLSKDKFIANIQRANNDLSDLIQSAPPLQKEIVTFRGVSGNIAEEWAALQPGAIIENDAFSSTSYLRAKSEFYMEGDKKLMLEVISPVGTKGVNVEAFYEELTLDNPMFGPDGVKSRTQFEWLLDRGTKFEVISNDGKTLRVRVVNG